MVGFFLFFLQRIQLKCWQFDEKPGCVMLRLHLFDLLNWEGGTSCSVVVESPWTHIKDLQCLPNPKKSPYNYNFYAIFSPQDLETDFRLITFHVCSFKKPRKCRETSANPVCHYPVIATVAGVCGLAAWQNAERVIMSDLNTILKWINSQESEQISELTKTAIVWLITCRWSALAFGCFCRGDTKSRSVSL